MADPVLEERNSLLQQHVTLSQSPGRISYSPGRETLKEALKSTGLFSSHLPGRGVPAGLISGVPVEVTCAHKHKNMHGNQLQVP